MDDELAIRKAMVESCGFLHAQGLVTGTSGNLSVRVTESTRQGSGLDREGFDLQFPIPPHGFEYLITPSSVPYDRLSPEMIVRMNCQGTWQGNHLPSSEWYFHRDILQERTEVNVVVHTHSDFATILSIARSEIPACHYLIALFGGNNIRCAPYARFGTQQLSQGAINALTGRWACLLSNHGAIALGTTLQHAVDNAAQLEAMAKYYYFARLAGNAVILDDAQIEEIKNGIEILTRAINEPSNGIMPQAPCR